MPSTPPHSATFPSPGGIWETQSGVTALSGSTGSGSGASYLGEPFTPTTPATPATPATSAHSSAFFSRSAEDAPPVPPVPGSSSGSPFAYNVDPSYQRERPKSNPQALSHSPHSSTSTTQAPPATNQSQTEQANGEDDLTPLPRTRPPQTLSLPAGVQGSSSLLSTPFLPTSAPTSPHPATSVGSPITTSVRPGRRQLPTPPGPAPANSFAQPWLYHSNPIATPPSTAPSVPPITTPTTPPSASSSASARAARASIRGSLRTAAIPPPPPPPQHSIPLPPKLAQEQQGYVAGVTQRPRTAPELNNGSRRRHSAGEFGEYSSHEGSSSVHPYAAAAHTVSGLERDEMVGRMQSMRVAQPGPSAVGGHLRAPSQPAPDYDAHTYGNMTPPVPPLPPLPIPPGTSGSSGMRSPPPGRRVLQVVNADASSMPVEDPGRRLPPRDPRLQMVQQLPPRMSYAESVYEMPPPAYDAIDFSVPPVPPSNSVQLPPLQPSAVEAGVEGHERS